MYTSGHARGARFLLVTAIGGHPPHVVPPPCPASATAVAASTLAPTILERSDRFVLTMVDTTDPSGYSVSTRRRLLIRPNSATRARARARGLGHYPRLDLQQVGTVTIPACARPDTAEIDAGVVYLGCRDCTDASPDMLRIAQMTAAGFRGSWRHDETGIAVVVEPFLPSAAFTDVWPVMEAWHRCGAALFASVPPVQLGVTPEDYREQLAHVSPAGLRAYQDAESAVLAFGLELRNEAGQAVRDVSIQVMEWQLFASLPDSERMLTEAEGVRQGYSTRGFVMLVTRARPMTTLPAG